MKTIRRTTNGISISNITDKKQSYEIDPSLTEVTAFQLEDLGAIETRNTQTLLPLGVKGVITAENIIMTNQAAVLVIELDAITALDMDIKVVCVMKVEIAIDKLAKMLIPKNIMEKNLRKRNFS